MSCSLPLARHGPVEETNKSWELAGRTRSCRESHVLPYREILTFALDMTQRGLESELPLTGRGVGWVLS